MNDRPRKSPGWHRVILLSLVVAAGPCAAQASAASCPGSTAAPVVEVVVDEGLVRIDHARTQTEIETLRTQAHRRGAAGGALTPGAAGGNRRTVGLTTAELRVRSQARGRLRPSGDGRFCVEVERIDLHIGYIAQIVHVPRRYDRNSCEYRAVLEHERGHVEDNRTVLRAFARSFREEAQLAAETMNPVLVRTRAEARTRPLEILARHLQPMLQAFRTEQAARAARHDSPDEYRRVAASCRNW